MARRDSHILTRSLYVAAGLAILGAATTVVGGIIGGRPVSRARNAEGPPEVAVPSALVKTENASAMGSPAAPAALMIFSDFQCRYCGIFSREILPTIIEEYVQSGKLRLFFRHVPFKGPLAREASVAAICAGRQGRFWEMTDALFAFPLEFDRDAIYRKSESIGIERRALEECLTEPGPKRLIDSDLAMAKDLGVTYTPVFLLGKPSHDGALLGVSSIISGAQPIGRFRQGLDRLINQ